MALDTEQPTAPVTINVGEAMDAVARFYEPNDIRFLILELEQAIYVRHGEIESTDTFLDHIIEFTADLVREGWNELHADLTDLVYAQNIRAKRPLENGLFTETFRLCRLRIADADSYSRLKDDYAPELTELRVSREGKPIKASDFFESVDRAYKLTSCIGAVLIEEVAERERQPKYKIVEETMLLVCSRLVASPHHRSPTMLCKEILRERLSDAVAAGREPLQELVVGMWNKLRDDYTDLEPRIFE